MATDSVPYRPRSRQLWQVPVFFLGVASLVGAYYARPYLAAEGPITIDRELRAARAALARSDADAAHGAAARALAQIDRAPRRAGEAHFLAGAALARLGPDHLAQARQQLELADRHGVPEADRVPHAYALAKVWFQLGVDAAQVVPALAKVADLVEDPFEAYGLLAAAYERAEPVDPAAVLEAVRNQVAKAKPESDPAALAVARLKLGDLLLKNQQLKEARLTLSRVGGDAPAELAIAAKSLLAGSFEQSQEWAAAAECWQQLRGDSRLNANERAKALYRLGDCLVRDRRPRDAAAVWTELSAQPGPDGQAAALRLAELRSAEEPAVGVAAFASALGELSAPDRYHNPHIPLDDLRALMERAIAGLRDRREYAAARKLAEIYARVARPGRAEEFVGRIAADHAADLNARSAHDPTLTEPARQQYRAAASAWIAAAAVGANVTDKAALLRSAADAARLGNHADTALEALQGYVALEDAIGPEKAAAAWYEIGDWHRQLGRTDAAREAFTRCLSAEGPPRWKARYQLGAIELDGAKADVLAVQTAGLDKADEIAIRQRALIRFDEAELLLQTNATELRQAFQPDAFALEWTTFGLADVAYNRAEFDRKDLATAEQHLITALQLYPESPLATKARLQLGRCHWTSAAHASQAMNTGGISDEDRERHARQMSERLEQAFVQFDSVESAIAKRAASRALTAEEVRYWKEGGFWAADCLFYKAAYVEAVARYETLAVRYAKQIEELQLLQRAWLCRMKLKQTAEAQAVLAKWRSAIEAMPREAFNKSTPQHTREYWEKQLDETAKNSG